MTDLADKKPAKPVVLTCAQPTGRLHLGNYLGAVLNWGRMQDDYECFFGIVDQHAITVRQVPAELRDNTYSCLAQYIACGLDPQKSHLFAQSHVIGHTELAWILGCLCPLGQLERMTQFKDKSQKSGSDRTVVGLFTYPILQAADIMLYQANLVPVGEDQRQHIELTRDLGERFNSRFGKTLTVPEAYILKRGAKINDLQDPNAKMSKSSASAAGVIDVLDSSDVNRKKIKSEVKSAAILLHKLEECKYELIYSRKVCFCEKIKFKKYFKEQRK